MKLSDLKWELTDSDRWYACDIYVGGIQWRLWKPGPEREPYPGGYAITFKGALPAQCYYNLDPVSAQCLLLEVLSGTYPKGNDTRDTLPP